MALPGSGTITIAMIATELGVGLPLDLNAANVRALAGVPSGPITMPNHFWGKSSYDPYPDAITWANISDSNIGSAGASISRTVTGLSGTISVTVSISTPCTIRKSLYLTCGGTVIADAHTGSSWTFDVTNGQTIGMSFGAIQQYSPKELNTTFNGTCTITNNTTGGGMGSFDFYIFAEAENPI